MKIEFDTATLEPREARGLTALLAHLGGTAQEIKPLG